MKTNRVIKFRAWDKENKCMYPSLIRQYDKYDYALIQSPIHEIMQFTGLHDKNGKDIYEGDIVEILTSESEIMKAKTYNAVIEWDDVGFVAKDIGTRGKWSASLWHLYEVIGNIWEHPQLLKNPNSENPEFLSKDKLKESPEVTK